MGENNQHLPCADVTDRSDSDSPQLAPPTSPGKLPLSWNRSIWPTVLGIICIPIASAGILASLWAIALTAFNRNVLFGLVSGFDLPGMSDALDRWRPFILILDILKLAIAISLLNAGSMILRRRRSGRKWALRYVFLQIMVAFAAGILDLLILRQAMAISAGSAPTANTGLSGGFTLPFAVGVTGVILIWYLFLPVTLLIWFRHPKVKDELANWPP